ncbi:MAG: hypothetical protein LBQ32_08225 [Burkholderiaceae bacterium]|jgi:hypothetical protein|nr:hypothetical protein [Burkholderiaceae bacterium]
MLPISSNRRALAACALLLATGLAVPTVAQAKTKAATQAKAPKSRRVKTPESSDIQRRKMEETRLMRECRGRPNAGACLGYANQN